MAGSRLSPIGQGAAMTLVARQLEHVKRAKVSARKLSAGGLTDLHRIALGRAFPWYGALAMPGRDP